MTDFVLTVDNARARMSSAWDYARQFLVEDREARGLKRKVGEDGR